MTQQFLTIETAFEQAVDRVRHGDLETALSICNQVASRWMNIDARVVLARVEMAAGKLSAAIARVDQLAAQHPECVEAHIWKGIFLVEAGQFEEAAELLEKMRSVSPLDVDLLTALAMAKLSTGHRTEALDVLKQALQISPTHLSAWLVLARSRLQVADAAGAEQCLKMAESISPILPPHAWFQLAGVLQERKAFAEATVYYKKAIEGDPGNYLYRSNFADMLCAVGRVEEGLVEQRLLVQKFPDRLRPHLAKSLTLSGVPASSEEVAEMRLRFSAGLDGLAERASAFKSRPAQELETDLRWCNYLLAYQGENDIQLQRRYASFVENLGEIFGLPKPQPLPVSGRKIRIGFAGSFFYNCTVGWYFSPWIRDLPREKYDVFIYSLGTPFDGLTKELAATSVLKRRVSQQLTDIAREIISDRLDILVFPELGLCPTTFALASFKLACFQLSGWGHPVTPGFKSLDGHLSCSEMEPDSFATHYSEPVYLLPGLGTRYSQQPVETGTDTRSSLVCGSDPERPRVLVSQSLFKIHPDNDLVYRKLVDVLPEVKLFFFEDSFDRHTELFKERLARQGMEWGRNLFLLPRMSRSDFLAVNRSCDVMLDTLRWSGGNTSIDALTSGLPVVTCPGEFMRGRQSEAMLRMIGAERWVTASPDGLAALTAQLASGRDRMREERDWLKRESLGLVEQQAPIVALLEIFEGLWSKLG